MKSVAYRRGQRDNKDLRTTIPSWRWWTIVPEVPFVLGVRSIAAVMLPTVLHLFSRRLSYEISGRATNERHLQFLHLGNRYSARKEHEDDPP